MAIDVIVCVRIDVGRNQRWRKVDVGDIISLFERILRELTSLIGRHAHDADTGDDIVQLAALRMPAGSSAEVVRALKQPKSCPTALTREQQLEGWKPDINAQLNSEHLLEAVALPPLQSFLCRASDTAGYAAWSVLNMLQDDDIHEERDFDNETVWNQHGSPNAASECRTELAESVRGRSQVEVYVLLLALRCVAVSYRRLDPMELFDAVMTMINADHCSMASRTLGLGHSQDLMSLCSSILFVREDGDVDFSRYLMKRFVLESEPAGASIGHETMTQICLRRMKRLLQPWRDVLGLVSESTAHPFLRYAQKYWKNHYGQGESARNDLPARLLHSIELEVTELLEDGYLSIEIRRITLDIGLDLALAHGWSALQRLCQQMGGQPGRSNLPGLVTPSENDRNRLSWHLATSTWDEVTLWDQDRVLVSAFKHDSNGACKAYATSDVKDLSGRLPGEENDENWVSISSCCKDQTSFSSTTCPDQLSAALQNLGVGGSWSDDDLWNGQLGGYEHEHNETRHDDSVEQLPEHEGVSDWETIYKDELG